MRGGSGRRSRRRCAPPRSTFRAAISVCRKDFGPRVPRGEVLEQVGLTDQQRRPAGHRLGGRARRPRRVGVAQQIDDRVGGLPSPLPSPVPCPAPAPSRDRQVALPATGHRRRAGRIPPRPRCRRSPCQSQHSRAHQVGETRFSVGTFTRARPRPAPSGPRPAGRRPRVCVWPIAPRVAARSVGSAVSGGSGLVRAASSAASHTLALRRCLCPPKIGSAVSSSTVFGSAIAAATIAESGRMRPGAMSRLRAIWSRTVHSSRTAPALHGLADLVDARGAPPAVAPGRGRLGAAQVLEFLCGPTGLVLLCQDVGDGVPQLDEHLDVEGGVVQPGVRQWALGPVGRPCPGGEAKAEQALDHGGEVHPLETGQPPGQFRVVERGGPARPRPGRAGPGRRRAGSTHPSASTVGDGARRWAAAVVDRVDQHRPAPVRRIWIR